MGTTLVNLPNLTSLNLERHNLITNAGLGSLVKLKSLFLIDNDSITDIALLPLVNLTSLILGREPVVTVHCEAHLSKRGTEIFHRRGIYGQVYRD